MLGVVPFDMVRFLCVVVEVRKRLRVWNSVEEEELEEVSWPSPEVSMAIWRVSVFISFFA